MAITIEQQPYQLNRVGQRMIYVASSTNVANGGFRYYFEDVDNSQGFFISPNATGKGIFDASNYLKGRLNVNVGSVDLQSVIIASTILNSTNEPCYPLYEARFQVSEAWIVDGVLTVQAGSEELGNRLFVLPASYNVRDGFRPNPANTYAFANIPPFNTTSRSLLMGDRDTTTHRLPQALAGISLDSQFYVATPVRRSGSDFGIVSCITAALSENDYASELWVQYRVYADDAAILHSEAIQLGDAGITHIPAYPANINVGSLGFTLTDYPNYAYYTIQLSQNENGGLVRSALYIYYPVDDDCNYENIRLCWWSPIKGGFDFFNFTKLSEKSVNTERKRIVRSVGSWEASAFSFNTFDRGQEELTVVPSTTLEITSDWIQDGEFRLLSNLVRSRYVWIIEDDGTATPVVVDTNSFTERLELDGKLKKVNMTLKFANENFYY